MINWHMRQSDQINAKYSNYQNMRGANSQPKVISLIHNRHCAPGKTSQRTVTQIVQQSTSYTPSGEKSIDAYRRFVRSQQYNLPKNKDGSSTSKLKKNMIKASQIKNQPYLAPQDAQKQKSQDFRKSSFIKRESRQDPIQSKTRSINMDSPKNQSQKYHQINQSEMHIMKIEQKLKDYQRSDCQKEKQIKQLNRQLYYLHKDLKKYQEQTKQIKQTQNQEKDEAYRKIINKLQMEKELFYRSNLKKSEQIEILKDNLNQLTLKQFQLVRKNKTQEDQISKIKQQSESQKSRLKNQNDILLMQRVKLSNLLASLLQTNTEALTQLSTIIINQNTNLNGKKQTR